MRALIILPLLLSFGCKKTPAEAPGELGDLGLFLFKHFEDTEDLEELEVGLVNMRDFLQDEDYSSDPEERAVTMPILDGEWLGSLSIPSGADAELQVPIAMSYESEHEIGDHTETAIEPNQVCIESGTTVWAGRDFLSDEDCYDNGSCDELETVTEVRKESLLAKVWYDQYKHYRRLTIEDESGEEFTAVIARSWTEEVFPADGGNNSWDQLFQLDIYIEDDGSALRWFSMWSSVTLGGIGDDAYAGLVKGGIADAFIFGDEFIDGNIESCNNDRQAEKPPRE